MLLDFKMATFLLMIIIINLIIQQTFLIFQGIILGLIEEYKNTYLNQT